MPHGINGVMLNKATALKPSSTIRGACIIGAFPPPVHGLAAVNAAVRDRLRAAGRGKVICIDTAHVSLSRSLVGRLGRVFRIVPALARLAVLSATRTVSAMYIGVSGGFGQVYDIGFLAIARAGGLRRFCHHHSFAYLRSPSLITRMLVWVGGRETTHVLLCPDMKFALASTYPNVVRTIVVSNAAFMQESELPAIEPRERVRVAGFLGNISREKGVFEFIDTIRRLVAEGVAVEGVIAGPFENAAVEREVMNRLVRLDRVRYVGPKYGTEKTTFYREIDVLVFPSRYANEAEPLTVLEAMQQCAPVIAWERGCIADMIKYGGGFMVPAGEDFSRVASAKLREWVDCPEVFRSASRRSREAFEVRRADSMSLLDQLCENVLLG
jgi:glycosyltransferase involved in cell wall biosynthesis